MAQELLVAQELVARGRWWRARADDGDDARNSAIIILIAIITIIARPSSPLP